jgi:DNA invertase Pin-like site-specific DNA recombinase
MFPKITAEHLGRSAVVYVGQSTVGQVAEHTESQRRQYALAESARSLGFASVTVIDDDLGRSGSGLVERPGFQKLVASVCSGLAGAVFCIEASRLARNGRDWHHLIDLCALVGTPVIDPDGTYDPRLVNDRLLLGLKGTMSEYELSLLRQRGIAARDSKALRGELQFILPPGYCWNEIGQIEMDPDERISGVMRLFEWRPAAHHTVLQILRHPVYAGAYVFGRTTQHTRIVDGRARKTTGHSKPMTAWNVLLRDHHSGYISWEQYEANQKLISENAHMQQRTERKSARGGRALRADWSAAVAVAARCGCSMARNPATLIATNAAAMTVMSAAGCASASAVSGSIAPSPRRSSKPFRNMPSTPRSRPPINR